MKGLKLVIASLIIITGCVEKKSDKMKHDQQQLSNEAVKKYDFLKAMNSDNYFPKQLVERGKAILVNLSFEIETNRPKDLSGLYRLTQTAANRFNDLQEDFIDSGSEIETIAAESIAFDIKFIANAYGFASADIEELIATREW